MTFAFDEERWATDPKFALMAKGRKSAVKLFDSEAAAKLVMEGLDAKKGKIHSIVKRPGEQKRCGRWCDAAPFCEQYQKILKQGENDE